MPLALILSSYVAAARVGGGAQQFALAPFGIDPVLVPTVLFGRSPARGRASPPAHLHRRRDPVNRPPEAASPKTQRWRHHC